MRLGKPMLNSVGLFPIGTPRGLGLNLTIPVGRDTAWGNGFLGLSIIKDNTHVKMVLPSDILLFSFKQNMAQGQSVWESHS